MANSVYYLPNGVAGTNINVASTPLSDVGTKYHVAFEAQLPSAVAGNIVGPVTYGFMIRPNPSSPTSPNLVQRTDMTTKQDLIQYSSPNLTDRDLVYYPRVSDGDFSGGMLQAIYINPQKFWDSDLNIGVGGYLQLNPAWGELAGPRGVGSVTNVFTTVASNYIVVANTGGTTAAVNAGGTNSASISSPVAIATDGNYAYVCAAGAVTQFNPATGGTTTVASSLNGTLAGAWVVNMGSNSPNLALFYVTTAATLYYIPLTASFPVATGSQPQVAMGSTNQNVLDLCAYQTGVAFVTGNSDGEYVGGTAWYWDGQNTTLITYIPGYSLKGICNCQGNLYVTGQPLGYGPLVLFQISSGVVTQAVRLTLPIAYQTAAISGPAASADTVFFNLAPSPITGIASNYTMSYNTITSAIAHLPVNVGSYPAGTLLHPVIYGSSPCYGYGTTAASGSMFIQFQNTVGTGFTGNKTYAPSGWMITSSIDCQTPSIPKQFHEVNVTHMPIPAGGSIEVIAYTDIDPTTVIPGTTTPAVTPVTNSTAGSSCTTLTFPAQIVARSVVVAIKLTAGTSALSTPVVKWIAVEISTPWAWEMYLDCTSNMENGYGDSHGLSQQGIRARDLSMFWQYAQEYPGPMTLYIPKGDGTTNSYLIEAEEIELMDPVGPHTTLNINDDSFGEKIIHLVARQTL